MKLSEYKETLTQPVRPRTVTFLVKDNDVCLGLKMRGFGKGNYLGIGGKVENDKDNLTGSDDQIATAKNGARREIKEEIGIDVQPEDLLLMGILRFYFPHISDESWNQEVYVFVTDTWQGNPTAQVDSAGEIEIQPEWIKKNSLPLDKMWDDARFWLAGVLSAQKLDGEFLFDSALKVIDHEISYN